MNFNLIVDLELKNVEGCQTLKRFSPLKTQGKEIHFFENKC
jgi:hypothetical protein